MTQHQRQIESSGEVFEHLKAAVKSLRSAVLAATPKSGMAGTPREVLSWQAIATQIERYVITNPD